MGWVNHYHGIDVCTVEHLAIVLKNAVLTARLASFRLEDAFLVDLEILVAFFRPDVTDGDDPTLFGQTACSLQVTDHLMGSSWT